MKLAVTVNADNYESLKIESNEHDFFGACINDVRVALSQFKIPQADEFDTRFFGSSDE